MALFWVADKAGRCRRSCQTPPRAMLDGSAAVIAHERKAKLVAARAARVNAQQQLRETAA